MTLYFIAAFNRDFTSFNETIHFNVGEKETSMPLQVRDDLRVEAPENFTLLLMRTNSSLGSIFLPLEEATLQIQDNDSETYFTCKNILLSK